MKQSQPTKISMIELRDTNYKMQMYVTKIRQQTGPSGKMQKLCHLAIQTFLKCGQSQDFARQNYERIKNGVITKKNYYLLYLLDLLIKNNKFVIKIAKKQVQCLFKSIWQKVWNQPKNSTKIQNLKAMARTWGIIYGNKIQQNLRKYVQTKYNSNLKLSQKNEEILKQNYQIHKSTDKDPKISQVFAQLQKDNPPRSFVIKKTQNQKNLLEALDL